MNILRITTTAYCESYKKHKYPFGKNLDSVIVAVKVKVDVTWPTDVKSG
jgi:hypothetical protein